MEAFGSYDYEQPQQLPYTTEQFLKELPLAPTAPVGQLAGQAASFVPLNPAPLVRGAQKLGTMVGEGMAERVATGRPMLPSLLAEPQSSMFIVPPSEARNIDMPVSLPQSKEFATAVKNEPSAQITDEGLLINLVRKQSPEQAMAESVRTGVFYLPEGQAANLKHYKGKSGYGGSEMIEGQTLYKNPIFVKGATGGKAPESAYDQVIGKGAYEEMRKDVLNSYGYNANRDQKVEAVQGLLQKYNGLDSDDAYNMAYNIVINSKTGNTLPYAIQENIVGHAVRNAGHDAVIGYSKGRGDKGEFFSEIFDVREQAYPNTQGGYELMPKFDQMRQGKSDILAGLLPASLLADPETRRKLDEELSLLYTK
jgi:hypothetical protein